MTATGTRRADARNRCILCGSAPVTRAHIISRSIRDVLPPSTTSRDMITRIDFTTPYPRRAAQRTWERGSDILSVQPKVLCGPCNNDWMSVLEDRAAPVVASMITRERAVELDEGTKQNVAEWAVAAAIVRGEVIPGELLPIDRDLAQSFRQDGIGDLPVFVAAVNIEEQRELGSTGPVASSYIHDFTGGIRGHLIVFWLRELVIVVATRDFAWRAHTGLRVVGSAVATLSPTRSIQTWPLRSSLTDRTLMRALDMRVDEMPRQSFDFTQLARGRSSIDAFMLQSTMTASPFREIAQQVAAERIADAARRPDADGVIAPE